ncbi:MAG: T9SS type A sorting domain-containing protein [FCB group bacterium]|jgi:photosystem II stability/assembly factor-like uncharacterized protein
MNKKRLNFVILLVFLFSVQFMYAQWQAASTGFPVDNMQSITAIINSGNNLFASTAGLGVFMSTDDGANWSPVNNGLVISSVKCLALIGNRIFAGTSDSSIFISTNSGANWFVSGNGLDNADVRTIFVNGNDIYLGSFGNGAYKSTDNGMNWMHIDSLDYGYFLSFAKVGNNLFAGTYNSSSGDIYISSDNGMNWILTNASWADTTVLSLAGHGNNIYAGTDGGGILYSTNNGNNWTIINNGLRGLSVECIIFYGTYIIAGTEDGVYFSSNNGTNWYEISQGLTDTYIHTLLIKGTTIYAGSNSGGIFKANLSAFGIMAVNDLTDADNISMFPNPVNDKLFVSYSSGLASIYSIIIINNLGVPVIEKNNIPVSNNSVEINTSGLATGVYFCTIRSGNNTQTKKFVIIR